MNTRWGCCDHCTRKRGSEEARKREDKKGEVVTTDRQECLSHHLLDSVRDTLLSGEGKVLVIQTAFLGDVILITPLLRAVKKAYPSVRLSVVTIPECAGVLDGFVDEIIRFDKRNWRGLAKRQDELVRKIRSSKFDVALMPHRSLRSGIIALRSNIPCRIGFGRGAGSLLLTHRIPYKYGVYEGKRNLGLVEKLAPVNDNGLPELRPGDEEIERVEKLLAKLGLHPDGYAVLSPGSVWRTKRWHVEHFRELAQRLEKDHDLPVLTVGGEEDKSAGSKVVSNEEHNLAGKLTPLGSAAVISRARFAISGDTAPAHIGIAMGTRQVIIFGSTSPRFGFVPDISTVRIVQLPLWCHPCSDHGRNFCPRWGSYKCLNNIKPDMVMEVIKDWLSS